MDTVSDAVKALGGTLKVATRCSVGAPAVSGWIAAGKFPAGRFEQIEGMATEMNIAVPRRLFDFATTASADPQPASASQDEAAA